MTNIRDNEWRRSDSYVCRTCGDAAFINKVIGHLWRCKACGLTTHLVFVYFKEKEDGKVPVQAKDISNTD